jgi:LuxR family transcriptional regulator, quorum-sensing system regulator BjaR1
MSPRDRANAALIRQRAFDFVEALQRRDAASVIDALRDMLGQHGFEYFCCAFAAPLVTEVPARKAVLAERLPTGFLDAYSQNQFVWDDPSLRFCKTTVRPFRWFKEAPYDPKREPRAVQVMQCAWDFGMRDGYMIPVISPSGRMGFVWFGGHEIDLDAYELPALHFVALYAFDRLLRLSGHADTPQSALTRREREVLTLAALGRSTEAIAEVLNITESTVKKHVKSCCERLGAANRTHAVMIAMRDRIIAPRALGGKDRMIITED